MMKYLLYFLCVAIFFSAGNIYAQFLPNQTPSVYWNLVFSDDFNGTDLNNNLWDKKFPWHIQSNVEEGRDVAYRKIEDNSNHIFTGSSVKLVTRKENYTGTIWDFSNDNFIISTLPFKYTTGMLYSRQKFKYGYYEIRFRLPYNSPGLGPNFWLYNADHSCYQSEIDAFEIDAKNNLFTTNVHYRVQEKSFHFSATGYHGNITNNTWHTAGFFWGTKQIDFYLDGQKIRSYPNNPDKLIEMPLIVNINSPATNFGYSFSPQTVLPYYYEIDYVKVWQLKPMIQFDNQFCSFPATHLMRGAIPSRIIIGDGVCNATLGTGMKSHLMAYEEIVLNKNTTIEQGAELMLEVIPYQQWTPIFSPASSQSEQEIEIVPPPESFVKHK